MSKKKPAVTFKSEEARAPRVGDLLLPGSHGERIDKGLAEDYAKLLILCQHHGIEEGPARFFQLALALARELYPEAKRSGRKSKWTALNQGALVVEIERRVVPGAPAHGVEWACRQLCQSEPWASFLAVKGSGGGASDPAEALRQVYYAFKKDKWAAVMLDAFRFNEAAGTLAQWDRLVADAVRNPHQD
jgi:hypothetical protein